MTHHFKKKVTLYIILEIYQKASIFCNKQNEFNSPSLFSVTPSVEAMLINITFNISSVL